MTDVWPTAPAITHVGTQLVRESTGRFVNGGKPGPGRPKGARSRIGETLLALVADHVEANGKDALDRLFANDPEAYLRLSVSLMPRAGEPLQYGELDDEQLQDAFETAKRHKQVKAIFDSEAL